MSSTSFESEEPSKGSDNAAYEEDDTLSEIISTQKESKCLGKSVSIDVEEFSVYQPTTTTRAAVSVKNAYKSYSTSKGSSAILKNFSMTVKQGTIYSLLGASGCGKTTLLSCIVGLRKLTSGDISVLGARPGTKASGVPGKRVGYMPQEIALFGEFTIEESLHYYGRIYSMTSSQIEENITFLTELLNLPPATRQVGNLSGGQQRRVSFACSMIHNPELLLLDEPTVGVDALLRKSIWEHLVKLVSTGKTTVIITTHYIEEARQSNTIGLMRNGKLLVQESPTELLRKYKTNLLEDIVMELCLKDTGKEETLDPPPPITSSIKKIDGNKIYSNGNRVILSLTYKQTGSIDNSTEETECDEFTNDPPANWRKLHRASVVAELRQKPERLEEFQDSLNRLLALSVKNLTTLFRNIAFLTFILFCPSLQVIIVCMALGGSPKGLHFAVVNKELSINSTCDDLAFGSLGCPLNDNYTGLLSCQFLQLMDKKYVPYKIYDNEETALQDTLNSKVWGIMIFSSNYTTSVKERALFGPSADIDSIYGSRINLRMDYSNQQISIQINKEIYTTLAKMMRNISLECEVEPIKAESPIFHDIPIYGNDKMNFDDYVAPSFLIGILFFFPISSSGLAYIAEKRLGTLDRSMVAGVRTVEFMLAYAFVQSVILIIQTILAFGFLIFIFGVEVQGSVTLASAMCLLVGFAGISIGFLLSAVCSQEVEAVLLAMGTFVPNLLLAGLIWPIEGMPIFLQYIAYFLPCTLSCDSMRSIISRGVGLEHPRVWPGFVSTIIWIIIYWIILATIQKIKSSRC